MEVICGWRDRFALSAFSRNQEWEKIDDYLKNMEGIALDAGGDMTGNKAVDAQGTENQYKSNRVYGAAAPF